MPVSPPACYQASTQWRTCSTSGSDPLASSTSFLDPSITATTPSSINLPVPSLTYLLIMDPPIKNHIYPEKMIMGLGRFLDHKDEETCLKEKILIQKVINKFCRWEEQSYKFNFDISYNVILNHLSAIQGTDVPPATERQWSQRGFEHSDAHT